MAAVSLTLIETQEAIGALGIAGIRRIYTSANVPREIYGRDLALLMPDPAQPMTSSQSTALTLGGRGWGRTRVLNYVCLVAEIVAGRSEADHAEALAQAIDAVENAFCDFTATGLHNVGPVNITSVGRLFDSTTGTNSRQFVGFQAQLNVSMSY